MFNEFILRGIIKMKLCLKEIIKRIALLEQQKNQLLSDENQNCVTTYGAEEEKQVSTYSFANVRMEITNINKKIRYLKHKLHYANATVNVPEFNMTIGECIIHMAQLNGEKSILERMATKEPKHRRSTFGGNVDWTETNYSKDECRDVLKSITEQIMHLQMAIDRENLTHEIELD